MPRAIPPFAPAITRGEQPLAESTTKVELPPPCPIGRPKKSLIKHGTCWCLAESNDTYEIFHYFKRLKAPIWRLKIAVSVVQFRPWAPLNSMAYRLCVVTGAIAGRGD